MENLISELEMLHDESKHNASVLAVFISALNSPSCLPDYDTLAEALCSLKFACDNTLAKEEAIIAKLSEIDERV